MNKPASRYSMSGSGDPVSTVRSRPQHKTREQGRSEVSARVPDRHLREKERTWVYTPGSLWSHLGYGLGTLAVVVIPPLIPGVTGRWLIMGYMGALVTVFGVVCVWGMVRSLYSPRGRRRITHRAR